MIKESIAALLFVTAILIATPICVADTERSGEDNTWHHGGKTWQNGDRPTTKTGGEVTTATIRTECKDDKRYRYGDHNDEKNKYEHEWHEGDGWKRDGDRHEHDWQEDWKKKDDNNHHKWNQWDHNHKWNHKHMWNKHEWNHKHQWSHDHKWNHKQWNHKHEWDHDHKWCHDHKWDEC